MFPKQRLGYNKAIATHCLCACRDGDKTKVRLYGRVGPVVGQLDLENRAAYPLGNAIGRDLKHFAD